MGCAGLDMQAASLPVRQGGAGGRHAFVFDTILPAACRDAMVPVLIRCREPLHIPTGR